MAVTHRLDLRQSQTLVMTLQLQQAIKLLEMSNRDLTSYVEQELEQNPLLERGEESRAESGEPGGSTADGLQDQAGDGESGGEGGSESGADNLLDASDYGRREVLPDNRESPLDTDYENVYSSDGASDGAAAIADMAGLNSWRNGGTGGRSDFGDDEFGLEQTLTRDLTLHEHLEQQLG